MSAKEETIAQRSKHQYLRLTLSALGINSKMLVDRNMFDQIDLKNAILFSPNHSNNFALSIKGFPKNQVDSAAKQIFKESGITFFEYYSSVGTKRKNSGGKNAGTTASANARKVKKTNIRPLIEPHLHGETMVLVQEKNGVIYSLYSGLRNAIAHGNILRKNGVLYLYAQNFGKKNDSPEEKALSFLLITKDIGVVNRLLSCIDTVILSRLNNPKRLEKKSKAK